MKKYYLVISVVIFLFCALLSVGIYQQLWMNEQLKLARIEVESMRASVGIEAEYISVLNALIGKIQQYKQLDKFTPEQVTGLAVTILEQVEFHQDSGITSSLILAVIEKESGFDPFAESVANANGLMQVRRAAAQATLERLGYIYSPQLMHDPLLSVKVGTEYLVWLHRLFVSEGVEQRDNWQYSLMAYNNGPTAAFAFIAGEDIIVNGEYAADVWRLVGNYEKGGVG